MQKSLRLISERMMHSSSVRVIAGKFRRRQVVFNASGGIRPTPGRVRETLFNWLQADCAGAHCLDLCAGSGILGIEALSRGAKSVVFVDICAQSLKSIRATLAQFGALEQATFHMEQAEQVLVHLHDVFDVIFVDPPYHKVLWDKLLVALYAYHLLAPGAKVYVETPKSLRWVPPVGWQIYKSCCYASVEAKLLMYTGA